MYLNAAQRAEALRSARRQALLAAEARKFHAGILLRMAQHSMRECIIEKLNVKHITVYAWARDRPHHACLTWLVVNK